MWLVRPVALELCPCSSQYTNKVLHLGPIERNRTYFGLLGATGLDHRALARISISQVWKSDRFGKPFSYNQYCG